MARTSRRRIEIGKADNAVAAAAARGPVPAGDFAEQPLGLESAEPAFEAALRLAKQGLAENNRTLLQQADDKFEESVEAVKLDRQQNTDAVERRIAINRAIIWPFLGKAQQALETLEKIRETLTKDQQWLEDSWRALHALGTAYMDRAGEEPERAGEFRRMAIAAYSDALKTFKTLKRAPAWAERAIDRTSTLSNRAVAYIDNGEADLAYDDAVDAVKFLRHAKIESSDRGLNWAHTLRTKADALRLMADQRRPASEVREFRGLLNEAIQDLQHALSWLPVGDPTALHLQITALLGVTERDLGTFLANTESTSNKEEAASHLYRAICSFGSVLTYDADLREDLLKEINHIAQMLMILTPSAEDAWQISEICEKVITGLNDQKEYINNINIYHELFRQSFSRFIKKVCKTSFVGKSKKINALTEFIASLGVTESEAPEILAATLRRLGWDKSINLSPEAALVEGSREITSRGSAEPRADWRDVRKGDEDVFQFVEREFAAELAAGRMHKGLLSRYKNLRRDFYAYQRHHELPRELRMIPKKQEWLDRQVAEGKVKSTSAARSLHRDVVRVARARKRGVEPKL